MGDPNCISNCIQRICCITFSDSIAVCKSIATNSAFSDRRLCDAHDGAINVQNDTSCISVSEKNLLAVVLALLLPVLVACELDIGAESTGITPTCTRQLHIQWHAQDILLEMPSDLGNPLSERARLLRVFWSLPGPYVQTETESIGRQDTMNEHDRETKP